jgi:2-phosphoglycerate kinase
MERALWVKGKGYTSTFSRGLFANSMTRAGVDPEIAYAIAVQIKDGFVNEGTFEVDTDTLMESAYENLKAVDQKAAERFLLWNKIRTLRDPMIVLIGGASGVGTTTIAAEVAHRMGIRHVIGTDVIREVMRKVLPEELFPALFVSSFEAGQTLASYEQEDREIHGFIQHCEKVVVGVEAIIDRALKEGINVVVEGTHIVPGLLRQEYLKMGNVSMVVLGIGDLLTHKGRFHARSHDTKQRTVGKYMKNFGTIRAIHDYMVEQARRFDVPIIEDVDMEETTNQIMEIITRRLFVDR